MKDLFSEKDEIHEQQLKLRNLEKKIYLKTVIMKGIDDLDCQEIVRGKEVNGISMKERLDCDLT
jgi:hypothetical protein